MSNDDVGSFICAPSDSDSDFSLFGEIYDAHGKFKQCRNKKTIQSSQSKLNTQSSIGNDNTACSLAIANKLLYSQDVDTKRRRGKTKEERERLKQEKLTEKMRKQETKEFMKRIQPGNCLKYMRVIVDKESEIKQHGFPIGKLEGSGIEYIIKKSQFPSTITWSRKIIINGKEARTDEKPILLIWDEKELIKSINDGSLHPRIESILSDSKNAPLTLAVFGLYSYYKELDKHKMKKVKVNNKEKLDSNLNLSRDDIEYHFTDLQLTFEMSIHQVDTFEDLENLVFKFTNSIAQTPYKLDKEKREVGGLGWLASHDVKDSVLVSKNGTGLLRLWHQQLMQFNNCNLDTAQAIAQEYPSPLKLYEAYSSCKSIKQGEELLKDIVIRRSMGESAAFRKVGPELSKKIYYFFTSVDGDVLLSQE